MPNLSPEHNPLKEQMLSREPPLGTRLIIGFKRMAGAEPILELPFNYCSLDLNYYKSVQKIYNVHCNNSEKTGFLCKMLNCAVPKRPTVRK